MSDYSQYTAAPPLHPAPSSAVPGREIKSVPLYQHDQVPCSFQQQQQQQQQQQPKRPSEDLPSNPINGDLQDVIFYYQSQPDLLRLILQSKVEEDRRRAEEAKLRAKELDLLMLQHQQQQQQQPSQETTTFAGITQTPTPAQSTIAPFDDQQLPFTRRPTPDTLLPDQRSPTTSASMGTNSEHSELFSPVAAAPAGPGSSNLSVFPVNSYPASNKPSMPSPPPPVPTNTTMMDENVFSLSSAADILSPSYHQPTQQQQHAPSPMQRYEPYYAQRPRRRREMQAITKIVETREYPYADGYFWKNNGNTIQKKTGNKSVYYKCSNSIKGCPVNKTVTWKGNGEYLIKYRGEHFADCGRVQRVLDM